MPCPDFCLYVCGPYSVLLHATTLVKYIKILSHTKYLWAEQNLPTISVVKGLEEENENRFLSQQHKFKIQQNPQAASGHRTLTLPCSLPPLSILPFPLLLLLSFILSQTLLVVKKMPPTFFFFFGTAEWLQLQDLTFYPKYLLRSFFQTKVVPPHKRHSHTARITESLHLLS